MQRSFGRRRRLLLVKIANFSEKRPGRGAFFARFFRQGRRAGGQKDGKPALGLTKSGGRVPAADTRFRQSWATGSGRRPMPAWICGICGSGRLFMRRICRNAPRGACRRPISRRLGLLSERAGTIMPAGGDCGARSVRSCFPRPGGVSGRPEASVASRWFVRINISRCPIGG